MTEEGKRNTDQWYPVVMTLRSNFYTVKRGLAHSNVRVLYTFEGQHDVGSLLRVSIKAGDWTEPRDEDGNGAGFYWLQLGEHEFTQEGKYQVIVEHWDDPCIPYRFIVQVKDKMEAELQDDVDSMQVTLDILPRQNNQY